MKNGKTVLKIALGGVAWCGILIGIHGLIKNKSMENLYPKTAIVVKVWGKDNLITCFDGDGNLWDFRGSGFSEGDIVSMIMDNNGTPDNVEDDKIYQLFHENTVDYFNDFVK